MLGTDFRRIRSGTDGASDGTDGMYSGDRTAHLFMQLGMLLFLLGLLTGFAIPLMAHARMGVASHLEGVLNGMFLVVLGLLWTRLVLPGWAAKGVVGLAVYGTFANWLATFLAAFWGAGGMTPLAGGGAAGTAMQEGIVAVLLVSLSLAMVTLSVLVLWGLARPRKRATPSAAARAPLEARRAV